MNSGVLEISFCLLGFPFFQSSQWFYNVHMLLNDYLAYS